MWQNKPCARPSITERDVDLFSFLTIINREYFMLRFCILDKISECHRWRTTGSEPCLSVLMIAMKMGTKDNEERGKNKDDNDKSYCELSSDQNALCVSLIEEIMN